MPRKGRLVQPRHIFPWIAAPYIEMLRILWRIERFFFMPIRYLQAWTVSAIFGVLGVFFSVALFIPRLTETHLLASPDVLNRLLITEHDLPYLAEEDLVLPEPRPSGISDLAIKLQRTRVEDFDQNEIVSSESRPIIPKRSSIKVRDHWLRYRFDPRDQEQPDTLLDSYLTRAQMWDTTQLPLIPEYIHRPGAGDVRSPNERTASLHIQKTVPEVHSPDEPLTYIISVTNRGDEVIETAIVEEIVSDPRRVIDCEPRAYVSSDQHKLIWDLSDLQPRESRRLSVTIQPDKRRQLVQQTFVNVSTAPVIGETLIRDAVRSIPEAPVEPDPEPVRPAPTPVARPAVAGAPRLVLKFTPSDAVEVGQEVQAYYTITNVGTADATGVRLIVEVPPQLRHRFGTPVEHNIHRLAPNESRRALFAALAMGPGNVALEWTLEADDLPHQADREWLAVTPDPDGDDISITTNPPVRSSIPAVTPGQPTLVPAESLPTELDPSVSEGHSNDPVRSSIPTVPPGTTNPVGPTTLPTVPLNTDRTAIPSWFNPNPSDPVASDPKASTPIDPELAPDEEILPLEENLGEGWLPREISPPSDEMPLEPEIEPAPGQQPDSTIPPLELPADEDPAIKAQ